MKIKRILAAILVGALAISALSGCKSETDEFEFGVAGDMQQNQENSDGQSSESGASNQQNSSAGNADYSSGSGSQNQSAGNAQNSSSASNQDGANQGSKPNSNQSANQNNSSEGSSQGSSSAGLKQTFNGGSAISISAGETLWYGPASTAQKEQLTFTDEGGKSTKVTTDQLQKVATFGNGYVIYAYKASAAGKVTLQIPDLYKKSFIASKDAMDMNAYYGYWDNVQGRNLYDAGLDKSTKRIGVDGKAKESDQGGAMHAIPVEAGDTLTIAPVSSATLVQGCGYDADMNAVEIISGYGMKEAFSFPQGKKGYTYTVPAGISYVRFNVPAEEADRFMVMKNKEFDLTQYARVTKANVDQVEDPLYKKECLFVGDSICSAGHDTKDGDGLRGWARRVKELSGAYCTNAGVSGAALSDCRLDSGTEYHIIHKQISKYSGKDFDYVLIHGGTNDAWDTTPIGKVTKEYDPTFFDLSTYAGGLEMAIYTAITEYGDTAAFGYLMNFQMPRNTRGVVATKLGEYFAVGKEICEKWNISYFDMFNHTEINKKMAPMTDEHLPDGTHPDDSGYDILGPYINDYMKSMTPVTQKIRTELSNLG